MRSEDSLEIPGKRMRPFDIRDFILRRSLLILFAGLGVFLLLSPVTSGLSAAFSGGPPTASLFTGTSKSTDSTTSGNSRERPGFPP